MDGLLPIGLQVPGAREQVIGLVNIEGRQRRRTGQGVARIGMAVKQFYRRLGTIHESIMYALADKHRAHGDGGIGDPLGRGHDIGKDAEAFGGETRTKPPESGDHLIEDQEDAMGVADFPQPFEIAHRRDQRAGRPGHGLDDDGGDGGGTVEPNQTREVIGQMGTPLGLTAGKGVVLEIMGMAQMIDARKPGPELPAVIADTAHRHAGKVDPVISALPADEAGPSALAPCLVIGNGDLKRGLHRFGA